jgi:hypothetical protein
MKRTRFQQLTIGLSGIFCCTLMLAATTIAQPTARMQVQQLRAKKMTSIRQLSGMQSYGQLISRTVARTGNNNAGPRVLASQTNSSGKIELLAGGAFDRKATASGRQRQESGSSVICQARPFQLDFTTVGSFEIFRGMNLSNIFPGNIVTPQGVLNGTFVTKSGLPARKAITLSTNLLQSNTNLAPTTVANPINATTVDQAVDALINQHRGATIPTQATAQAQLLSSSLETSAELQVSAGALLPLEELGIPGTAGIQREFGASGSTQTKIERYTVSLFEPMYTVTIGESGPTLFQDPNAAANVDAAVISSVTYGRVLLLTIEGIGGSSKLQAFFRDRLSLGLEIEGSAVGVNSEVNANAGISGEFQVMSMKATIIGGNSREGNALTAAILTGEDAKSKLRAYITARSSTQVSAATAAVPIAYTMEHAKGNQAIGVRFTTEGDILFNCEIVKKLRIELLSVKVTKVMDNPLNGNNEDLFGTMTARITSGLLSGETGSKKLWDYNSSSPLQLAQNKSESYNNKVFETTIDPDNIGNFKVQFDETMSDHFDNAESVANFGKTSAPYEFTGESNKFTAQDLRLQNGPATRIMKLQEPNVDSKVEVTVRFSLVD